MILTSNSFFQSWWTGERKKETYHGMKTDKQRKQKNTYGQEKLRKTKRKHYSNAEKEQISSLERKDKSQMSHKDRKELRNHKMQQLNLLADDLNEMAVTMGEELKHQNKQVNEVSEKMAAVNEDIVSKNVKMERIRRG